EPLPGRPLRRGEPLVLLLVLPRAGAGVGVVGEVPHAARDPALYVNHVTERFGLRDGITFDTRVTAAHYDEDRRRWTVTTDGPTGETIATQFLIMATGCLSTPKPIELPGEE